MKLEVVDLETPGVVLQPLADQVAAVGVEVVDDQMDDQVLWDLGVEQLQKLNEDLLGSALSDQPCRCGRRRRRSDTGCRGGCTRTHA